jgi:hypothetical protein
VHWCSSSTRRRLLSGCCIARGCWDRV